LSTLGWWGLETFLEVKGEEEEEGRVVRERFQAPTIQGCSSTSVMVRRFWALGILLYTIVYKENPFYNVDEILDHPLRIPFLPAL
jgi:hypothetical protein